MHDPDRVLVTYSTKHGATAEIADAIAQPLRAAGLEVDVQRARQVRSLDPTARRCWEAPSTWAAGAPTRSGMVADDAGFIRKRMARKIPPELRDRRDWHEIGTWAQSIAAALTGRPVTAAS